MIPYDYDYREWAKCFRLDAIGSLTENAILKAISTPRIYLCYSDKDDAHYLDFYDESFGENDVIEVSSDKVQKLLRRNSIREIVFQQAGIHVYLPTNNSDEAHRLIREYFDGIIS